MTTKSVLCLGNLMSDFFTYMDNNCIYCYVTCITLPERMCVCSVLAGYQRMLEEEDSLEPEIQMVVSFCVGAGN